MKRFVRMFIAACLVLPACDAAEPRPDEAGDGSYILDTEEILDRNLQCSDRWTHESVCVGQTYTVGELEYVATGPKYNAPFYDGDGAEHTMDYCELALTLIEDPAACATGCLDGGVTDSIDTSSTSYTNPPNGAGMCCAIDRTRACTAPDPSTACAMLMAASPDPVNFDNELCLACLLSPEPELLPECAQFLEEA